MNRGLKNTKCKILIFYLGISFNFQPREIMKMKINETRKKFYSELKGNTYSLT